MKKVYFTLCLTLLPLMFVLAQEPAAQVLAEEVSCDNMKVYDIVEEESVPVGGLPTFYRFLGDNVQYPMEALKLGIEGVVYIRFVVSAEGNVVCAEIVEGRRVGGGLDEEAIRVLEMTKWNPAKQQGEAVNQRKILPVKFSIPKPAKTKKG